MPSALLSLCSLANFVSRHHSCVYIYSYGKLRQAVAVQQLYTDHLSPDHPETLVLYTYSNSDPEYERNMHFFVRHGMAEGDGCEYVITVQQVSTTHV